MVEGRPAIKEQMDLLLKGCVDVVRPEDLEARLLAAQREKRPLTVKVGFDPSAPDIHLGHTVVLRKMRHFQDAGHRVVFVIGDFTGMIGDPSGKKATRPQLTREEIAANAETYTHQIFKVLDPRQDRHRVQRPLARRARARPGPPDRQGHGRADPRARRLPEALEGGEPIALHELLYPLAQALRLGRAQGRRRARRHRPALQPARRPRPDARRPRAAGRHDAAAARGTDGVEKMSKSLGNSACSDPPGDMFGKVMSIPDALMWATGTLLTDEPPRHRGAQKAAASGDRHPRDAKVELARAIIAEFHAHPRQRRPRRTSAPFTKREVPDDVAEVVLPASTEPLPVVKVLVLAALAPSNAEARRLLQQGGVKLAGETVRDPFATLDARPGSAHLIQVGKRRFARIRFS